MYIIFWIYCQYIQLNLDSGVFGWYWHFFCYSKLFCQIFTKVSSHLHFYIWSFDPIHCLYQWWFLKWAIQIVSQGDIRKVMFYTTCQVSPEQLLFCFYAHAFIGKLAFLCVRRPLLGVEDRKWQVVLNVLRTLCRTAFHFILPLDFKVSCMTMYFCTLSCVAPLKTMLKQMEYFHTFLNEQIFVFFF